MDANISKVRSVARRQFSKSASTLESLIQATKADISKEIEVEACFKVVSNLYDELINLDEKIKNSLISSTDFDEKLFEREVEETVKYKARWAMLESNYTKLKKTETKYERKFKLPILEVRKFDGNIKNWLSFWAQFKKIDSDESIEETEKLQYLAQSMEPNSEVRALVDSFPLCKDSYAACLRDLKARYAREDILIQIYVRELLKLIINRTEKDLTILYDSINSHLRALEVLNVTTDKYSAFLLPMIESALPTEVLKTWERSRPTDSKDELNDLLNFLKKEVDSNQRVSLASEFALDQKSSEPAASCLAVHNVKEPPKMKCIWCEKPHPSTECFKLAKMTIDERREHLKKVKACALCLKVGHHAKYCKSYIKCFVCGRRHSPVLCSGPTSKVVTEENNPTLATQTNSSETATSNMTTLLQTVAVKICHGNQAVTVRALFDSGSQRTYVKEEVMKKLQMSPNNTEGLKQALFGGKSVSFKEYNVYNLNVQSWDGSYNCVISALGQDILCKNIPKANTSSIVLSKLLNKNKIILSDNECEGDIGLLIGADYSGLLLTNTLIQLETGLTAIKTNLGWTLQGKTAHVINTTLVSASLFCSQFTNFWDLEVLGIIDPVQSQSKQQREEEVLKSFKENIHINDEGRYEVHIPWKTGHDDLLSNRDLAFHRLRSTTNKLVSCGKFHEYNTIIQEWENLEVIERVPKVNLDESKVHYLPHRAVCKESSLTTKLRPVFDASAKDKNGKSLNSCLDKGINFLDKIPDLLIGLRKGLIGVSADIAKAFLQISVNENDRDYLRFLWWSDEARQDIVEYRHRRVVFGLTSSPFLLSATIQHHLEHIQGNQKNTAQILSNSFYVDNLITSLDTVESTVNFIKESKAIMADAKFNLRQWVTSSLKINETGEAVISVLGMLWDTASDELLCNLNNLPVLSEDDNLNKRIILSLTQKIFDPVGILCSVTLVPRIILQQIWSRKITWDEELPTDIRKQFYDWYNDIHLLNSCRIPRRLSNEPLKQCTVSLHMFCDSSKEGYAACVFIRVENSQGNVTICLVSAKSRISPPEKMTIPRLELLAALIGSRLIHAARKRLENITDIQEFCWSDSCVALCWIKRQLEWNTYVGNRVREIRQNTNLSNWYHISGNENWADLPSRGCNPTQFLETRWWEGPKWLLQSPEQWPKSDLVVDEKEVNKEMKKSACLNSCLESGTVHKLDYFSKYSKIIRMVAWIMRFKYNCLNKDKKRGEITYEEYEKAELIIFKICQQEEKDLIEKQTEKLSKFYDENNLLRLNTKLLLTNFSGDLKTPIILSAKHVIVRRMVEQRHLELLHAGTNMMITDLRKRVWIIGIRRLVKSVIDKCVICRRHRAKATQVPVAPLPVERVQAGAPFEVTGVDLAGPIYLRNGDKSWIVLFTCAVYRAIHLELTLSLSTEAFMRALRRFIARRGRISILISDNGTNFTGTKNLFSHVDWEEVQRQSNIMRIKWKLNAPTAAWWGGFFERMVKIIKNLLRRVLGKSTVSYEEMETILCDCEAVVNGRPLTYVEEDKANSLEPLTPSCFLQALPQSQVTDLDIIDSQSLNKRLRYLQRLREDFRQRFKYEYLSELVQKGTGKTRNIQVGDIVLVETDERIVKWPLGLVVEIYKGKDNVERTAKVKTSAGYKIRPFQRLYHLELSYVEGGRQNATEVIKDIEGVSKITIDPIKVTETQTTKYTRSGREIRMPSKYNI